MERMNMTDYETQFWKVLAKGNLVDLSQFHKPDVCDEVPLYSRESDVAFLTGDGPSKDKIILTFGLKFLKTVVGYEDHDTPYFAALTVWDADDGPIHPSVFIWNNGIQKLYENLELTEVKTKFGKTIKKYLGQITIPGPLEIREDTASETSRVFIGPAIPPYKGFVPLRSFHKPIIPAKRESTRPRLDFKAT